LVGSPHFKPEIIKSVRVWDPPLYIIKYTVKAIKEIRQKKTNA
jgi:hypothetical protein